MPLSDKLSRENHERPVTALLAKGSPAVGASRDSVVADAITRSVVDRMIKAIAREMRTFRAKRVSSPDDR